MHLFWFHHDDIDKVIAMHINQLPNNQRVNVQEFSSSSEYAAQIWFPEAGLKPFISINVNFNNINENSQLI